MKRETLQSLELTQLLANGQASAALCDCLRTRFGRGHSEQRQQDM